MAAQPNELNLPSEVPLEGGNLNDGQPYERMSLLFVAASLSQNKEVKNFWIVSNPTGIGKIDDVIVRISFEDSRKEDIGLFVQVKHTSPDKSLWLKLNDTDRKPTPKCYAIKLTEYENSFDDLIKIMSSDGPKPETALQTLLRGVDVNNYYVCIFTNMENVDPTLQCKQFSKSNFLYFMDTRNSGQYRQFDYKNDARFNTKFYKQLYVFLGQPTYNDIDKTIAQVLGEDSKKMLYLDKVIKDFMQRDLFCGVLTKQEFELKLCEVVVNYWMVVDKKVDIIIEKHIELWNKLLSGEEIINLCDNNVAGLLAYHYQCVIRKEVDEYFDWQVGVTKLTQTTKNCIQQKYGKNVIDLNDLLFLLWRENKIPLAIKSEYATNILDFLRKFKTLKRRFVIFCSDETPELTEFRLQQSVITYVREITDKETLEQIFDLEVSLEGRRPVTLSKIAGDPIETAVAGIYKELAIYRVLTWTEERENIHHIIGPQLGAPDNKYIARNFTQEGNEQEKLTEEAVLELVRPGLHLITGEPGMGKSTVLEALAHGYSPQNFVIYIKLRDCLDDIANPTTLKSIKSDPLKYFFNKMTNNTDDKITKSIMEMHKTSNRLCLFLDAFEEIRRFHGKIISSLITTILNNTDITIFCTTSPHAEEKITSRSGTISFKLLPFDDKQIQEYFTNTNINDNIRWHLGSKSVRNPLHLYMMSQIYEDHENDDYITIGEMYQQFIELKYQTYYKEKNLNENVAHLSSEISMKQHRVLAMGEIFGEECVTANGLISDTSLAEIRDEIWMQNIGIVDLRNSNNSFQFVHRTFAEYFVADLLLNNIVQPVLNTKYLKELYRTVWYEGAYRGIKRMIEERTRNFDLWFEARKYVFINSDKNNSSTCTCDGFLGWLECTVSHSNANGSTIVDQINMDYPTRARLTEDDGDTCIKLLTAIHDEIEEVVVSNLSWSLLDTGMGTVAFNLAITTGNERIVKILLGVRPTLVDQQDVNGNTGLHISCVCGHSSISELLLEQGANFRIRNNKDKTPLGMVAQRINYGEY